MAMIRVFKFCGDGGKPFNSDDGNPFRWPLVAGETRTHDDPVSMCISGLHFSRTEEQAAQYAKSDPALGLWCLTVEIDESDIHAEDNDKFVLKSGAVATVVAVENRNLTGKDGEPTDISGGVWMLSGNATIQYVSGNATIRNVGGNATIRNVGGNATIRDVWGNATIQNVRDNATIQNVWDNATVVTFNGKIEHIIEDSGAFVVDRSGTHVAGYDAKQWNAKVAAPIVAG